MAAASPNDIHTSAGIGTPGYSGDGGPATTVALNLPAGTAMDASGNLYIADTANQRVRKVGVNGVMTTVAGNGVAGFSGDGGTATSASLNYPHGIAVDGAGNLYIADQDNNRVRKVDLSGRISTVAGTGKAGGSGDGGPAAAAALRKPEGLAVDASGNIFIADTGNDRIRKVDASGYITSVAGGRRSGYSGDGGPATKAQLNHPAFLWTDTGSLYIADCYNNRIRKVDASGVITTVAGNGSRGYSGDGGTATSASLNYPSGIAVDAGGNLYITDNYNNRVRKVDASGKIATFAGNGMQGYSGDGGPAIFAELNHPSGIALDASGNVYITDKSNNRVRMVEGRLYDLPVSSITSPQNGSTLEMAATTITGAASSVNGVAFVQVSADGGATWYTASGTASWSYNWTPAAAGTYNLLSRAADSYNNVEIISAGVTVTVSEPAPAPAPVTGGPVGYWKFDEASGTTALDSSGFGNSGALGGALRVGGVSGNAASFDGTGSYVRVPGTSMLKPASTVSVAAWVKTSSAPALGGEVVSMGDSYVLRVLPDGNVFFFFYTAPSTYITARTAGVNVLDGQWHHLAGVKSSGLMQIFVDGASKASVSTANSIAYTLGPDLYVGKHGNGNTARNFNGVIDEVRVYDRALSLTEVQTISAVSYPPVVINSLVSNVASPATAGSSVTWTASASGGSGTLQYQFLRQGPDTSGAFVVVQDYGASAAWTWATTSSMAGTNTIMVNVRNADGSWTVSKSVTYVVAQLVTAIVINSLSPSPATAAAGAAVTWTASASGGVGGYQYQFTRQGPDTGGSAVVAQGWSASNAWTWSTTSAMAGSNTITVSVKDTSTNQAVKSTVYALAAPGTSPSPGVGAGWWSDFRYAQNLAAYASAGSNLDYAANALYYPTQIGTYLNQAGQQGMKAILEMAVHKFADAGVNETNFRQMVDANRNNPALAGWFIADEPDTGGTTSGLIQQYYAICKQADPNHPVYLVHYSIASLQFYANYLDVPMLDYYPGWGGTYDPSPFNSGVRASYSQWQKLVQFAKQYNKKSTVAVGLGFGTNADGTPNNGTRNLSYAEYRYHVFTAIVQGVDGFLFWCDDWANSTIKPIINQMIGQVKDMSVEMKNGITNDPRITVSQPAASLTYRYGTNGSSNVILAVNIAGYNVSNNGQTLSGVKFTLPVGVQASQVEVLSENRTIPVVNGSFTDNFNPFGVHAYRFTAP